MELIKALWRGDVSLAKTFWLFGVGVNWLFGVGLYYLLMLDPQVLSTPVFVTVCVLVVSKMIYLPFICICIWRSANKYKGPQVGAILAKLVVIFGCISYIREAILFFQLLVTS